MITTIYSIRDEKLGVYMAPFTKNHEGEALRTYQLLCEDEKTSMHKWPDDFALWEIAKMDDSTGEITPGKNYITKIHELGAKND